MTDKRTTGPLIIGINGLTLDIPTREQLMHPAVGGVILFTRNFDSVAQVSELISEIRQLRTPRLLVTVDQEGGRVQRFRGDGLTPLPPLRLIGRWHETHPERACDLAYRHGRVMAAEMLALGVDMSFAPVLDLDRGSCVIGDRALSSDPLSVIELARFYVAGMRDAGMPACGKHFPGHGSVAADSHDTVVEDGRSFQEMVQDLSPFEQLHNRLGAVMMAHVCYPAVDPRPAGFSQRWIQELLKRRLGFNGLVISDDMDMLGAAPGGDLFERLQVAIEAGCDLALVCRPESAQAVLDSGLSWPELDAARLARLYGRAMMSFDEQLMVPEFRAWRDSLQALNGSDQ
ncbi:MAG: beta-N-acetylhexosaminidase [Wenzhouxiangella sp.]|jgi:beta-N-acetylhexosaminidase|nr:beta-N-acetylhexosaminidase [Wenzhouxiangella sp.]